MDLLTDDQWLRYSRHLLLEPFGEKQQTAILNAKVLVIGVGGLGSPAIQYLAGAGVGELILNDFDQVEMSNLQRQVIHNEQSIGELKTESAKKAVGKINSDVLVTCIDHALEEKELSSLISQVDLVLVGTDNFASRYLINKLCVQHQTNYISGAAIGFSGQLLVFDFQYEDQGCYQCLYEKEPDTSMRCADSGILGPVVGVVGTLQAMEAIKLLAGINQRPKNQLQLFDGLSGQWQSLSFKKQSNCLCCAKQ